MDFKIVWSPEAVEDLESIAAYISRDSQFYAKTVVSKIVETTNTLDQYPYLGRTVPELGKEDIRERFLYSYRLIYHIEEQRILIVAIIHGKRMIESVANRIDEKD